MLTSFADLIRGDAALARKHCEDAVRAWPSQRFDLTALVAWASATVIELYTADHTACALRAASLPDFERSLFAAVPMWRARALCLRAHAALCAAEVVDDPTQLHARAVADIEAIDRLHLPCFVDHVAMLRAALVARGGDEARAATYLDGVLQSQSAQNEPLFFASVLRRRGELLGEQTVGLVARADEMMLEQGVSDSRSMARVFAPALRRRPA
jgi:hypothetical protein